MLTQLLAESQIALPQTMVDRMGATIGDLFDISERDGGVFIAPIAVSEKDCLKMSKTEYLHFLDELYGCIDDPTFVEPPEILYESPREPIE